MTTFDQIAAQIESELAVISSMSDEQYFEYCKYGTYTLKVYTCTEKAETRRFQAHNTVWASNVPLWRTYGEYVHEVTISIDPKLQGRYAMRSQHNFPEWGSMVVDGVTQYSFHGSLIVDSRLVGIATEYGVEEITSSEVNEYGNEMIISQTHEQYAHATECTHTHIEVRAYRSYKAVLYSTIRKPSGKGDFITTLVVRNQQLGFAPAVDIN